MFISGSAAFDPKPGYAAVATINAAINALAKAFAEQGIKDGVQVNSVSPGAVMTGRRRAFFETWGPMHNLTVEEAIKKFPAQAGITRFGKPEEIADRHSNSRQAVSLCISDPLPIVWLRISKRTNLDV